MPEALFEQDKISLPMSKLGAVGGTVRPDQLALHRSTLVRLQLRRAGKGARVLL